MQTIFRRCWARGHPKRYPTHLYHTTRTQHDKLTIVNQSSQLQDDPKQTFSANSSTTSNTNNKNKPILQSIKQSFQSISVYLHHFASTFSLSTKQYYDSILYELSMNTLERHHHFLVGKDEEALLQMHDEIQHVLKEYRFYDPILRAVLAYMIESIANTHTIKQLTDVITELEQMINSDAFNDRQREKLVILSALWYELRGISFNDVGMHQEALDDFTTAVTRVDSFTMVYFRRGYTKYSMNKYWDSISDFSKAISLDPFNASFYNARGVAFQGLGMQQEALADYERTLEIDPNFAPAWQNKATLLTKKYRFIDALKSAKAAYQLSANNEEYKGLYHQLRTMIITSSLLVAICLLFMFTVFETLQHGSRFIFYVNYWFRKT